MAGTTVVVGVFDTYAQAERAADALAAAGLDRSRVEVTSTEPQTAAATGRGEVETSHDEGIGDRIGNFFRRLFGGEERAPEHAGYYSEAVRRGRAVVAVEVDSEAEAHRAADVLDTEGAVDIEECAKGWRQDGWAGSPAGASGLSGTPAGAGQGREGEQVIPVVREELDVGKRKRDGGGARIYTRVSETPAQEDVTLREEHVEVERRPADRPATEADFAAFREGTVEVRETVEEPVVSRRARVVEEVVVDKEVSERTETVNDVLRKGEVDVQRLDRTEGRASVAGGAGTGAAKTYDEYDADYRAHWQANLGRSGGAYEDYLPAYRYGSMLAEDERYRNRAWNDIEADARRDWETRYPRSTWDRFKAAVRHGWERVTGKR